MNQTLLLLMIFLMIVWVMISDSILSVIAGLDFISSLIFIELFTHNFLSGCVVLVAVMFVTIVATEGVMGLSILSASIIRLESSSFKLSACTKL
uniref:NADH dehydrogenase subunit 4L n=1 Tax=Polyplax spinulosa TaxID=468197 RepID=V9PXD1_9NEOP|nr:NADH dehydrogenase subunit 4L [Polyplax spinulosa]